MATGCSGLAPYAGSVCADHTDSPAFLAIDAKLLQFEFFFVTVVVRDARQSWNAGQSRTARHTWDARDARNARDAWSTGNARCSR